MLSSLHSSFQRQWLKGGAIAFFVIQLCLACPAQVIAAAGEAKSPPADCTATTYYWTVDVARGFETYWLKDKNAAYARGCIFRSLYTKDRPPQSSPVGSMTVAFSDAGLQITYDFKQSTPPLARVLFASASHGPDDTADVFLGRREEPGAFFNASVNPAGTCSSKTTETNQTNAHAQCSVAAAAPKTVPAQPNCGNEYCWSGRLTISYDYLRSNNLFAIPFRIAVGRTLWGEDLAQSPKDYYSVPDFGIASAWIHVTLNLTDTASAERFLVAAPTAGLTSERHRAAASIKYPLNPNTVLGMTIADSASTVLGIRNKALKNALPADQMKRFKCANCASFQTDAWSSFWDPSVTTKSILRFNFAALGVDTEPFDFASANYPVDAGFKFISRDDWASFAIMGMRGSSTNGSLAQDYAVAARFNPVKGLRAISGSLYHVGAIRSDGKRTTNTELSVGYTNTAAPEGLITHEQCNVRFTPWYGALVRYGSQYGPNAQRLDLAVSANFHSRFTSCVPPKEATQVTASIGFRSIGANYAPLDSSFDPVTGLRGFYGAIEYANPAGGSFPINLAITAHRFSDDIEVRDNALGISLEKPLGQFSPFTLTAGVTVAQIAVSQVARSLGFGPAIPPGIASSYLPNSSYSANLVYGKGSNVQASIGYTRGYAQNCSKSPQVTCYAYIKPALTYSAFVLTPKGFFLNESVQSQYNSIVGLPSTLQSSVATSSSTANFTPQQTTANHIVEETAVGMVFRSLACATIAFTHENQGGDFDSFANQPPQPGHTDTYSLDFAPTDATPGILIAYARGATLGSSPPATTTNSKKFFVRLLFGVPGNVFIKQIKAACS